MKYQKTMDDDGNSRSAPIILQNIIVILSIYYPFKAQNSNGTGKYSIFDKHTLYLLRDIMTLSITYN